MAAVAPADVNSYKLELLSPTKILPVSPPSTTGTERKLDPGIIVAPVVVHPAPVVAVGITALNSNCVPLNPAAITVCVPLIAGASAALQLPLAVTPAMVTNSPILSEFVTVTVTVVAVAVTPVGAC